MSKHNIFLNSTMFCFILLSNIVQSQTGCWSKVISNSSFSLAIKNDGTLWGWGANNYGQLGLGDLVSRYSATQVGNLTTWKDIASSDFHSFGIKEDGSLWAWGFNGQGRLGDGTTIQRLMPVQIGTSTYKQVSCNNFATLAIRSDGTLWAWGSNGYSLFGNGTSNINSLSPLQIGSNNNWKQICLGIYHAEAIKEDGTLWGWGYNGYGITGNGNSIPTTIPIQTGTDTNWESVTAGHDSTLAIKTDGTLWSWGTNQFGMFGNGTNEGTSYVPIQVGESNNWNEVDASFLNAIALKDDGTMWSWGQNFSGQLGNGTQENSYFPVQIGINNNWKQASIGTFFGTALNNNGDIFSWGQNITGQLGLGNTVDVYIPTLVDCPISLKTSSFQNQTSITIYPNPVGDNLYIDNKDSEIDNIIITDIYGKKIIECSNKYKIDLTFLSSGIYFLNILQDNSLNQVKFIKK